MDRNSELVLIQEILLKAQEPICIFSHPYPDGDSIGSTVGLYYLLRGLGKEVFPVMSRPLPGIYDFLLAGLPILEPPVDIRGKIAVILDCGDLRRLHQTGQTLTDAAMVINIDHHLNNEYFGDYNFVDASAAAVGLIIHEMFQASAYSTEVAEALFCALYTDTGRFSYSNADARALSTGAELIKLGANPQRIFNEVYQNRSLLYYKFLAEALINLEMACSNQVAILSLDRDILSKYSLEDWELDDINDYPRSLKGVMVSAVIKESGDEHVKVSLRSKGDFNVADLAKSLGGGGHLNAAGATVQMSVSQVKSRLISFLKEELGQ